jgi:dCMP deaminase
VTKQEVLHSKLTQLLKCPSTESSEGATMFCTHAPCINCAKLIYQSGINSLYYRNTYRDTSGLEFLESSGVIVNKYES